ncbi:MAG: oligosaccharide flippase family protein [Burkholderiales bacterium]|nr:oligosaccharide flippase family protein [Burkholderiales bacterium]
MSHPQASPTPAKPTGLQARVIRAGSWVLVGHVGGQALRLGSNLILTRLLAPEAFGLMAMVYMLMVGLTLFSDLGIYRSVVQSPRGNDGAFLDTAWTLQVLRGAGLGLVTLLAAVGFATAGQVGWVQPQTAYGDPLLPWVIAAFALVALLQGLESIRVGLAKRTMQMQALTRIDLFSQFLATLVMVILAWLFHSVWALVIGALVAAAARSSMGYLWLEGPRARWRIEPAALAELISSGKWVFLSSILGFLAVNGDRLILGGLIDAKVFGLYAIAFLLVNALQVVSSTLCNNVAYPAFSEIFRDRPTEMPRVIEKFQWAYDGLAVTAAALMVTGGPAIIKVLYDHRYLGAGWMMSVLALGAIGLRVQLIEQCYQAVNKPQYTTLANLARLGGLVLGVLLGYRFWGLEGAVAGIALSQFATWPQALWFRWRYGALRWRIDAMLLPALVGGALLGWALTALVDRLWA